MTNVILKSALAAVVAFAGHAAVAEPNLVASLNKNTGNVKIQNIGAGIAPKTVASVRCNGACPNPTPAQLAGYQSPLVPNGLAIKVPAISAGGTFNHQISFWNDLEWPVGTATLTVCADALNDAVESMDRDNCASVRKVTRKGPKTPSASNTLRMNN
ncbi:MAG: CARDB domain-containing protein [Pseudomonadota bacterium]